MLLCSPIDVYKRQLFRMGILGRDRRLCAHQLSGLCPLGRATLMWRDSQSPPEGQPERRKRRARYLKARQEQRSLAVAQAHYGGMLDDI